MELTISIIGAVFAVLVSVVGAYLANKNSIILQTRKLKEAHYINYVSSLHSLCADNDNKVAVANYVEARDILFSVASTKVIANIIIYEKKIEECKSKDKPLANEIHDKYLTILIKSIRKDLKLDNNGLPTLFFKKA